MVEIHLNLDPESRRTLTESLAEYALGFETGRSSETAPGDLDPDLQDLWRRELEQQLREDAEQLLAYFCAEDLGKGVIRLDADEADAVMRACSAVRLHIRELVLEGVSDASLESGDFDVEKLSAKEQRGLQCYIFLAALQSHLVEAIDPDSAESGNEF